MLGPDNAVVPAHGFEPALRPTPALLGADGDAQIELDFRSQALQLGFWLGWLSIIAVLGGVALDAGSKHRWLLVGLTLAAAFGNAVAMFVPWREWLQISRGRLLLDLWSGGLIGFVALLVFAGGPNFSLLLLQSRSSRSSKSAGVEVSGSPSAPERVRSLPRSSRSRPGRPQ